MPTRNRYQKAVETFPSESAFVATKVRRAKRARAILHQTVAKPLHTPAELEEIRAHARLNYPKTKQDKLSYHDLYPSC